MCIKIKEWYSKSQICGGGTIVQIKKGVKNHKKLLVKCTTKYSTRQGGFRVVLYFREIKTSPHFNLTFKNFIFVEIFENFPILLRIIFFIFMSYCPN